MPDYVVELKALASTSPRAASIHFVGPRYGAEKRALLRDSWVVVVPSFTEVVGMVNLEAASFHTPTITNNCDRPERLGFRRWRSSRARCWWGA